MKEPQFVLVETVHFYDMQSGVTVSFHKRENQEWFVRLWYKSDNNVIATERIAINGKPKVNDAREMFLRHQEALDKAFPFANQVEE